MSDILPTPAEALQKLIFKTIEEVSLSALDSLVERDPGSGLAFQQFVL